MNTQQLYRGILGLLLALITTPLLWGQSSNENVEFGVKAGLNIGATTPLPKPKAIDKIYTWNPHMNIALKGWLSYQLPDTKGWHLDTGLEMERKGMYVCTHATNLRDSLRATTVQSSSTTTSRSRCWLPTIRAKTSSVCKLASTYPT